MRKKEISSDNLEDIEQSGRQCVLKIIVICFMVIGSVNRLGDV